MYYEVVILLRSKKNRNKELQVIKEIIMNISKSNIFDINYIGKKKLAYSIKKEKHACYVILTIKRNIKVIEIIKKRINILQKEVLRYLILKVNKANKDKII
ncbi:30S ribosomal protein S6 [Candidatus Vidania fulgoroideorum]